MTEHYQPPSHRRRAASNYALQWALWWAGITLLVLIGGSRYTWAK